MNSQRGAFAIGLIVGLLVGLALALAVALYVTKVPVPFLNKVPQRTAEQDAAEAERNKTWDPNAPLAGKVPVIKTPAASAPSVIPPGIAVAPQVATGARPVAPPAASAPGSKRDPAAILAGQAPAPTAATPTAPGKSTKASTDPFTYFVQVGAFSRAEEAEQQRARVGMMGMPAKVSEREQSGRTVYRVRLGPYERKDDADAVQERLANNGVEAALVRVER
jgi:cell division protein FtsN